MPTAPATAPDAGAAPATPAVPLATAAASPQGTDLFGEGSVLLFDPEVGGVVQTAIRDQWPAAQVADALRSTGAFAEIQQRRQALADPARGEQARTELSWQVARMVGGMPDDPGVKDMTDRLASGAATMGAVQTLLTPAQMGTPLDRVVDLAAMHGIPMRPETAAEYVGMAEPELDQFFGQWSDQMYPYKPPGLPYQRFARMFADLHATELGQGAPSTTDPVLGDRIAQAQGNPAIFQQLLRATPDWEQSPNGQQAITQRMAQTMQDLGFGQAVDETMQANLAAFRTQTNMPQPEFTTTGGSSGGGGGSFGGGGPAPSYAGLSPAEAWIISHESGNRPTAKNPNSTAFGLGQLLDYNRVSYAAKLGISNPNTTNYDEQLAMFRLYYKERYGSAERAQAFWRSHGWY